MIRGWLKSSPAANVGLVTGEASGVVILDVDPEHGGDDALHELEQAYHDLPRTVEAITGTGGRHLLFRHPEVHVASSAGKVAPGLDVRAAGGLAVMPPSRHANGRRYEWDVHPDEMPLADIPPWLLAVIQHATRGESTRPRSGPIPAGERNPSLTRMAGHMALAGFAPEAIQEALQVQNRERCTPPLEAAEVERIARNAARWDTGPLWITRPGEFITDPALDAPARLVLFAIATHANSAGTAWPGYRRIATVTGLHGRQISSALNLLEKAGRLEIRRARSGNRYRLVAPEPLSLGCSASNGGSTEGLVPTLGSESHSTADVVTS